MQHVTQPSLVSVQTATATPEVRRAIVEELSLQSPTVLAASFNRPNIRCSTLQQLHAKQSFMLPCTIDMGYSICGMHTNCSITAFYPRITQQVQCEAQGAA